MVDDSRSALHNARRFSDSSVNSSEDSSEHSRESSSNNRDWYSQQRTSNHNSSRTAIKEIRDLIKEDPELYGIRRSSRSRKEALSNQRLTYDASSKEDCSNKNRRRVQIADESSDEQSSGSSESSLEYRNNPRTSRNTRGNRISYKNAFADEKFSDSDSQSEITDRHGNQNSYRAPPLKSLQNSSQGFQPPKACLIRKSQIKRIQKTKVLNSDNELEDEELQMDFRPATSGYYSTEESDVIEEVLTHDFRRIGSTGNASTFYNCRIEDDPNANFDPKNEKGEQQYLIKWKNWSHLHSTWETEETLRSPDRPAPVLNMKKLDLYRQRMREKERFKMDLNADDLEAIIYEEERSKQALYQYMVVERIVAHSRDSESDCFDYLIKWKQLEYRHCTWESGTVINELYPEAIEEYKRRCQSTKQPASRHEALRIRPKFTRLLEQPNYIGDGNSNLKLREYQLKGLNWLAHAWTRGNSVILADEMGLGKTVQTISFLAYLFNEFALYGPFLLVVPLSTVSNWAREAAIWAPYMNIIVYTGDSVSRQLIREHEWSSVSKRNQGLKFNICVTTYEILLKDKAWLSNVTWAVLGVDEAHRLKNDASQLYKCLYAFNTNCRLLITGTPLQNSLKELWALLHFIMPSRFEQWEQFESQYSVSDANSDRQLNVFRELHRVLEPFLLRRVKKDVEYSLPAKIEQILRVEMTSKQADIYKLILAKNYDGLLRVTNGNKTSFVNIMMELKKCCNHAYLIAPPNYSNGARKTPAEFLTDLVRGSGKLMLLDKLLQRLKPKGHRVLIFSQMVRMLDLIANYLELRNWGFQRLDGSISGEARKQALDHFNAEGSNDFCFLLSTRAGGLGINLATADTVIIFDSDWNPQNDLQAQARAHRIGQTKQVSVYRLVTKESIEEKIIESATRKMVLDHLVIQRMDTATDSQHKKADTKGKLYTEILKYGAEGLFKRDENADPDVDIDDILNKAETRDCNDDGPVSQQASALLSTFNIVNIDRFDESEPVHMDQSNKSATPKEKTWSEIIPQNMIDKMKAEDDHKRLLDLELGPRVRKKVNMYQAGANEDSDSDESSIATTNSSVRGVASMAKGLSDKDIRNLLKSIRRFSRPQERIEVIIADAELTDSSVEDIKPLVEAILKNCRSIQESSNSGNTANFTLGRVSIPVKPLLQSIDDLDVLSQLFDSKSTKHERLSLELPFIPKSVNWSCAWNNKDDVALLLGVFLHGLDNWEAIKLDSDLGLGSKMLPVSGSDRPQATHIKTRVDYLLKTLFKQNTESEAADTKPDKECLRMELGKKYKNARAATLKNSNPSIYSTHHKSAEFVEDSSSESSGEDELDTTTTLSSLSKQRRREQKKAKRSHSKESTGNETKTKKRKKENAIVLNTHTNNSNGPMHFTAHKKPTSLQDEDEEQFVNRSGSLYDNCKAQCRPIRKHFQSLEQLEDNQTFDEAYTQVVGQIGDHIRSLLKSYESKEDRNKWRYYLWRFVKIFSAKNVEELQRLYKKYRESPNNKEQRIHSGGDHHEMSKKTKKHHRHQSPSQSNGSNSSPAAQKSSHLTDKSHYNSSHHHHHSTHDVSKNHRDHDSVNHRKHSKHKYGELNQEDSSKRFFHYSNGPTSSLAPPHRETSESRFDNAFNRIPGGGEPRHLGHPGSNNNSGRKSGHGYNSGYSSQSRNYLNWSHQGVQNFSASDPPSLLPIHLSPSDPKSSQESMEPPP